MSQNQSSGQSEKTGSPTFLSQLRGGRAPRNAAESSTGASGSSRALVRRLSARSVTSGRASLSSCRRGSGLSQLSVSYAQLSDDDIRRGFQFLDVKGKGKVSLKDLRDRLHCLQPWEKPLTKSEVMFLTKNKPYLSLAEVQELMQKTQGQKTGGSVSK